MCDEAYANMWTVLHRVPLPACLHPHISLKAIKPTRNRQIRSKYSDDASWHIVSPTLWSYVAYAYRGITLNKAYAHKDYLWQIVLW